MKVSLTIKEGVLLFNQPNTIKSAGWLAAELEPNETVILLFNGKKMVISAADKNLKIEER